MKRASRSCEAARPAGASDSSNLHSAIIRALDGLEFGNVWEATEILLAALEDVDLPRRFACPSCGLRRRARRSPALLSLAGSGMSRATCRGEYLSEVVGSFERWLYLPDARALLAVLGAVSANLLPGDPLWLVVVGPPGGGKTELLNALGELEAGAKGGLLREIGDFGILLCKDLGSVLSMNRDARAAVLAALREVFDGSWTRHVGTGGGRTLHWRGKVGLVAGCTPTI